MKEVITKSLGCIVMEREKKRKHLPHEKWSERTNEKEKVKGRTNI